MHSSPFGALPLILSNERSAAGVQQQKRALFFSLLNTVDEKAFFSHRPDVKKSFDRERSLNLKSSLQH